MIWGELILASAQLVYKEGKTMDLKNDNKQKTYETNDCKSAENEQKGYFISDWNIDAYYIAVTYLQHPAAVSNSFLPSKKELDR